MPAPNSTAYRRNQISNTHLATVRCPEYERSMPTVTNAAPLRSSRQVIMVSPRATRLVRPIYGVHSMHGCRRLISDRMLLLAPRTSSLESHASSNEVLLPGPWALGPGPLQATKQHLAHILNQLAAACHVDHREPSTRPAATCDLARCDAACTNLQGEMRGSPTKHLQPSSVKGQIWAADCRGTLSGGLPHMLLPLTGMHILTISSKPKCSLLLRWPRTCICLHQRRPFDKHRAQHTLHHAFHQYGQQDRLRKSATMVPTNARIVPSTQSQFTVHLPTPRQAITQRTWAETRPPTTGLF